MSMSDSVMVQEYDTVIQAKDAEKQLSDAGIGSSFVRRNGKKLNVAASHAARARALLASGETAVDTLQDAAGSAGNAVQDAAGTAANTAKNAATTAADTVQDAATGVANTAKNAVSTATNTVQNAVGAATDAIQNATGAATDAIQNATGTAADATKPATSTVREQANNVSSGIASNVRTLASNIRQQGASPNASGVQRQVTQTAAGAIEKTSEYIAPGGISTLLQDLRAQVRSNPGRVIALGLGIGYLLRGRFFPSQTPPPSAPVLATPPTPDVPPLPPTPVSGMPLGDLDSTSVPPVDTILPPDEALLADISDPAFEDELSEVTLGDSPDQDMLPDGRDPLSSDIDELDLTTGSARARGPTA